MVFFFFSSRRRHTRSLRDWSSDVCSSDLGLELAAVGDVASNAKRTCAEFAAQRRSLHVERLAVEIDRGDGGAVLGKPAHEMLSKDTGAARHRSEERRVGKEGRSRR